MADYNKEGFQWVLGFLIRTLLSFPFAFKLIYFMSSKPFEIFSTVTDTQYNKHSYAASIFIFSGKQKKAVIAFIL